jgi:hypothetical protein
MTTAPKSPPVNPLKVAGYGLKMKRMCDFHGGSAPEAGGRTNKRTKMWKCAACVALDNTAKGKP